MENDNANMPSDATPPIDTRPQTTYPDLRMDDSSFLANLESVQSTVRYQFRRPELVREALLGERVTVRISGVIVLQGNQKMALLGDTVLKTAYMDSATRRPGLSCDTICQRFNWLGSNEFLERKGREWYIHEMIMDSEDEAIVADRIDVASAVEAIIGAVWTDSNNDLETVKIAIRELLGQDVC